MLFKKYIAVAAALLIAAGMMAGCKKSGNESENSQISVSDNSSFVSEPVSSDESSSVSEESSTVSQVSGTAAHTHSYTEKVIEPTCTADGYTLHECSCGKSYKDKTVSKKGHSFGEWTVTRQATTSAEGEKTRKCSVCGATEIEKIANLTNTYTPNATQLEVLKLVNTERSKQGLKSLEYRGDIQWLADTRLNEIINNFSHTRPDGTIVSQRGTELDATLKKDYGIQGAGENIAKGNAFDTPYNVMYTNTESIHGWMFSESHRDNIYDNYGKSPYTGLVVSVAKNGNDWYWVQIFVG